MEDEGGPPIDSHQGIACQLVYLYRSRLKKIRGSAIGSAEGTIALRAPGRASAAVRGRSRPSLPRRAAASAKLSWRGGKPPRRPHRACGGAWLLRNRRGQLPVSRFDIDHPVRREPGQKASAG